jgi:hypothetical protein
MLSFPRVYARNGAPRHWLGDNKFKFLNFYCCRTIAAQKCVLKFLPSRVALGHASSLLGLLLGTDYFAGLKVTKRNKATVLLTLTLLQTPTLTLTLILTLT